MTEIPGGIYHYDSEAQANADVEQTRAEALEVLRTAESYSLYAVDQSGRGFGSSVASEEDAPAFLALAAAKAFRNVTLLVGAERAREIVDTALEFFEEHGK